MAIQAHDQFIKINHEILLSDAEPLKFSVVYSVYLRAEEVSEAFVTHDALNRRIDVAMVLTMNFAALFVNS